MRNSPASGDPTLLARRFDFLVTDAGLSEVQTYADGIGPWKRYIVSTAAIALDSNGNPADVNGDNKVDEADRKTLPPTDLIQRLSGNYPWNKRRLIRHLAPILSAWRRLYV